MSRTLRRPLRRPALRLASAIAIIYLIASAAGGVLLAEIALRPPRRSIEARHHARARELAARLDATLEDAAITTADGVPLRGWFLRPNREAAAVVILAHGVVDNRVSQLPLAGILVEHGYAVLAPDARSHGDSGGLATYGVRERHDVRQWIDWVDARLPGRCVVGIGGSMGAAHLLQALPDERRMCGVVAEASFATFREAAFDRLGRRLHGGSWMGRTVLRPIVEAGLIYAWARYGPYLGSAAPVQSVPHASVPILAIQGTDDESTPMRHGQMIQRANPHFVSLWIVPGGAHTAAWRAAPEEYPRRVLAFIATATARR